MAALTSLSFAGGHTIYGIIFSIGLLTTLWKQPLRKWGLPALLGIPLFAIHIQEVRELSEAQEICETYSLANMQVRCSEALVIESEPTRNGYSSLIKTCEDNTKLHATEHTFPANSQFIVYSKEHIPKGSVISLYGTILPQHFYNNVGEFDWQSYHKKQGVITSLRCISYQNLNQNHPSYVINQWRNRARNFILSRILHGVAPSSQASWVLPALVLGQDPPDDELLPFRNAGVMHLFVVSGLHVGLVITIIWILAYFTPLSSPKILAISIIIAWTYIFITGAEPPAVRAGLIITFYSFGLLFRQRINIWNSVIAALLTILILDRYALQDIGVILSFGVVFSLILIIKSVVRLCSKFATPDSFLPRELWSNLQQMRLQSTRWIIGILAVAIISWVTSSLITAGSFGHIYLYGVISTLILFPIAFCIMVLSALSLIIGSIYLPATLPINHINHKLADYTARFAEKVETQPNAVISVNSHGYRNAVTVFNLPQGAASIYIGVNDGILIDCGNDWIARSIIEPCLARSGSPVQTLFLSHDDKNHIGGHPAFPEAKIIASYLDQNETHQFGEVTIKTYRFLNSSTTRSDDQIALFHITTPAQTFTYISDAGHHTFDQLRRKGYNLNCDVLIVGKHSQEAPLVKDFANYTNAKEIIYNRTRYYKSKRSVLETISIDQRSHGAVQFPF